MHNRPSSVSVDAVDRLLQKECSKAVQQPLACKAPGADTIPSDVWRATHGKATLFLLSTLIKEGIQQKITDAFIIHIYKRKESPQVCDHKIDISLSCGSSIKPNEYLS